MKVCHFTSVHSANDVRIFLKECCSLAREGFEVHLIAPDASTEKINGVYLHGVPKEKRGRLFRMTKTVYSVYRLARSIDADLYQFHDPELLFVSLLLKLHGKRVIYDVHEDLPRQLLAKSWIPPVFKKPLSLLCEFVENAVARKFDIVITATEHIESRFNQAGCRALAIKNYPILDEFKSFDYGRNLKDRAVCYVGGISAIRGIKEMIVSVGCTDVNLILAGTFSSEELRNEVAVLPGWSSVEELGFLDRSGVADVLQRSAAGLVVLHPTGNYLNALPIKMFEYMAAGIPVIASNFPLWREIVEGNDCGLCVDPLNPDEIAKAITWISNHEDVAKRMGANGCRAVKEKYSWESESEKLLGLYHNLFV